MKKLLAAALFCMALALTASAHTVDCKSLTPHDQGTLLRYEVTNTGETGQVDCIAAAYSADGRMLEARVDLDSPPVDAGAAAARSLTFRTPSPAYAKVFALDRWTQLIPGGTDRVDFTENEPVDPDTPEDPDTPDEPWSLIYDFSRYPYADIGEITATRTVEGLRVNRVTDGDADRVMKVDGGHLAFPGGGSLTNFSCTVTPPGPCTVTVTYASTGKDERVPRILNSAGEVLAELAGTIDMDTDSWEYTGPGEELTLASASKGLYIYSIALTYGDVSGGGSEVPATTDDPSGQPETPTVVLEATTQAELEAAIADAPDGALIRLAPGVIPCSGTIRINTSKHLTIAGSEEGTTILDYSQWSDTLMNTPDEVAKHGINLYGSYVALKNFIIQGTAGTAIDIKNDTAHHILIENVVTRYNHNSGIYASSGAHDITIRNVDSYRNCDIYKKGQDADGFSISLSLGENIILDNCRAFENADDAYDNFNNHNDVTYLNCYAWNNGGVDVYTGKYDVDHGRPVDRSLPLVRWMYANSAEYKALLDSAPDGIIAPADYKLPTDLVMTVRLPDKSGPYQVTLGEYITEVWEGNGNGFKLGSTASGDRTHVGPEAFRRLENCLVFDNANAKGFDKNNSTATVAVSNVFSFNNKYNYSSKGMTVQSISGVYGYNGKSGDDVDSAVFPVKNLSKSVAQAAIEKIYAGVDQLLALLAADQIPGRFIIDTGLW